MLFGQRHSAKAVCAVVTGVGDAASGERYHRDRKMRMAAKGCLSDVKWSGSPAVYRHTKQCRSDRETKGLNSDRLVHSQPFIANTLEEDDSLNQHWL
jgi:hypothetical protein